MIVAGLEQGLMYPIAFPSVRPPARRLPRPAQIQAESNPGARLLLEIRSASQIVTVLRTWFWESKKGSLGSYLEPEDTGGAAIDETCRS